LLQKLEKDKQEIQIALENYVKQEEENKKQNLTKKIKSNLLSHLAEDSKYQTTGDCSFESQQTISLNAKDFVNPTNGVITSTFGCQHDGLDIAAKSGTSVVSIGDGIVYRYGSVAPDCKGFGCNGGFGNYVQIQHTLADGTKIYSLYGHMKNNPLVGLGSGVKKGQQIGEIGCTGYTLPYPCGVHLHFMIFDDTTEESGFGCRLGSSKCFDPQKFGFFQK
jgi:murein DD-endopeptidase MepM/ murein hydrolase activator NlpD